MTDVTHCGRSWKWGYGGGAGRGFKLKHGSICALRCAGSSRGGGDMLSVVSKRFLPCGLEGRSKQAAMQFRVRKETMQPEMLLL